MPQTKTDPANADKELSEQISNDRVHNYYQDYLTMQEQARQLTQGLEIALSLLTLITNQVSTHREKNSQIDLVALFISNVLAPDEISLDDIDY